MSDCLPSTSKQKKYWAFISYSHKDTQEAKWLHRAIEGWRLPSVTRAQVRPRLGEVSRLFPVFRDRDELPNSANLGQSLTEALEESRALIVICSPRSARSRWVNEEVLYFKRTGRADWIFPVIIDGVPNATDSGESDQECFCPALRHPLSEDGQLDEGRLVEPIAADLRPEPFGDGRQNALLKTVAGILSVPFDSLKQRDRIRRQRRIAVFTALGGLLLSSVLVAAYQTRQQSVAIDLRKAGELLALAEARFSRADYDAGSQYLNDSIATRQRVGEFPTTEQMALIYRSLLFKPGEVRVEVSGVGKIDHFKRLGDGEFLLASILSDKTPLIKAKDFTVKTYFDFTPVSDYLAARVVTAWERRFLSISDAEIDKENERLYILARSRIFEFDITSGTLVKTFDLAEEPSFKAISEVDGENTRIYQIGEKLGLEMGGDLAVGTPGGKWMVISGRTFVDWDVTTRSLFLKTDRELERHQGGHLQARYRSSADQITNAERQGRLLTLAEESGEALSVAVLDAESLSIVSRCSIPTGKVVQTEPIASNLVLVKTEEPSALLRYRLDGNSCHLEEVRSDTMSYFDYRPETNDILLSGIKDSELIKIDEDGFKSVIKVPYAWAQVTKQGRWYVSKKRALIEVWPDGPFWIESFRGSLFSSVKNAMLFNTESGLRVLSDGALPSGTEFLISPSNREHAGGYLVLNRDGRVVREILPDIDDETISEIISKSSLARRFGRKDSESRMRAYGNFWHAPIMENPYRGYIYGRSLVGALTRVNLVRNRLEVLPVPEGKYSIDAHAGNIWIGTESPNLNLFVYSIEKNESQVISGSREYFSSNQEESAWPYYGKWLAFSSDGKSTLAFNASGKWAVITDFQLESPASSVAQNIKLTDAVSEAQAWIVATHDERLIRLSRDGNSILNQAPLRPGAKEISLHNSHGLILVGANDGVALHDSETLLEIALIPGTGTFKAVDSDKGILLAIESRQETDQWKIYRLPAFGDNLLIRIDDLHVAQPTKPSGR